ncbi:MAG: spore germination protein [Petroclostridium sp.]|jgi:spore germination protein KA|uniref:spore germination protein n=1 Tax=Petroclostridium xylanilyticum TaxID=1792311 RepID=UPI000B97D035|nr:spore germination protein [Petroclostridium xylanilyticum]MBZ4644892.1 spore gernimation protein [Clostridia bacterium]MDK2809371.1 spore germination protein [Petroclostridium sp.]
MFKKIIKRIKYLNHLQAEQKSANRKERYFGEQYIIHKKIENNLTNLRSVLGRSNDVVFREFKIGTKKQIKAFICCIDGLIDKDKVNQHIIRTLMVDIYITDYDEKSLSQDIQTILKDNLLSAIEVREVKSFDEVLIEILAGGVALFIDGYDTVFVIGMRGWAERNIDEPDTEAVVRGSREGFTETLRTNTALKGR